MIEIYIGTDARSLYKKDRGHTWYIMQTEYKGKPFIKKNVISWFSYNKNGAILEGILYALRQILAKKTKIIIYTDNAFVRGHFSKIPEWEENGYMKKCGEPIEYRNLWTQIGDQIKQKSLQIVTFEIPKNEKKMELEEMSRAKKI